MAAQNGLIEVYICETIFDEIRGLFYRNSLRKKFPVLTATRVRSLLINYRLYARMVTDPPSVFSLPRDADDEIFVNLAVAVEAECLVTRDRDLLDLRNDAEFFSKFPLLQIVNPVEFLQVVRNT